MEHFVDCLLIELDEIESLKPVWLRSKPASCAVRSPVVRTSIVRKRNKGGQAKARDVATKAQPITLHAQSNGQASDMGGTLNAGSRDRFLAYPEFIAKALSAADEAQAAGESQLTVALVEVVCELLYEIGRRP